MRSSSSIRHQSPPSSSLPSRSRCSFCRSRSMRRTAVVILMCVELMLNAANLAFVAFSRRYGAIDERGSVFVVFVFVIAAAEVAVGLGIVLSAYRNRPVVDVDEIHAMKG